MTYPTIALKANADRRLKRGHLWIFSNEVDTDKTPLKSVEVGQQASIVDSKGKSLGLATINPNTLICGRLVSRSEKYPLDKSLLVHRIKQALALREYSFAEPFYRLVYGDSDLLPGLVVDRFGDYLVVQISTAGMEVVRDAIVEALVQVMNPTGILLRNDHSSRVLESLPEYAEVAYGEVPQHVELVENNTRFLAPVFTGQKTGWFYDHRANRQLLQQYVGGKRVLDVFSYIGGWGIQAAAAGASHVTCIDASASALDCLEENTHLNQVADKVEMLQGKAIEALKMLIADGEKFDVVVMDPPAFIKRRKDQKSGEAAYRHVNEMGLRLLGRDGLLVAASCSMHLGKDTLMDIVRGAGRHLERHIQVLHQGGHAPDHPVHPAIPETDYLKALFARSYLP